MPILTIVEDVPELIIVLSESIRTPPIDVDPVLRKLSLRLYESAVISKSLTEDLVG